MNKLYEQSEIGSIRLDNRTIRSATWSGIGDKRGFITDQGIELYRRLAKGGIGLIITGFQYVTPNGIAMIYQLGNYTDDQIDGLTRLSDAIHQAGGKVIGQLVHTGSKANPELFPEKGDIWGPSNVEDPLTGRTPKEMTVEDIRKVVEDYASAAVRCQKAGFDGVQLHGAHGYGLNQFLSGTYNKRGDAYGGDIDKRYRILGEAMEAVRGAVGKDYPVLIKLSAHDYYEGGLVPEESVRVARRLVDDGIDAIEVSAGSRASENGMMPSRLKIRKEEDEAYFKDLAAYFKESISVPIITVGGFRSPQVAEKALASRAADYVAFCRPLIREPHLINRWKNGDLSRATCISCNGCFETGAEGLGISCKIENKLKEKAAKADK